MLSSKESKTNESNGLDAFAKTHGLEEQLAFAETIAEKNPEAVLALLQVTLNQKHAASQQLEKLQQKLNGSQWRPAIFLRRLESFPERALVAVSGQRVSVGVAPGIPPESLTVGTSIYLDAGADLLVSLAPELASVGSVGAFSRFHGDRAVIVGPGEVELVVELGHDIRNRDLTKGDLLLFDGEAYVATDVVESRHQHATILQEIEADKRIEELAGLEDVFEEVVGDVSLHLFHAEVVARHRANPVKGIILTGPPGVGKTSLIKCIARRLNELPNVSAKVFVAPPSIHRSKWHGESEERIRAMFAEVKLAVSDGSYALLVFDDVDHLGSRGGVNEIDSRILPSFLHEIDELRSVDRVLLVGSTNRPDLLDEALMRSGRFGGRQYAIPRPGTRQATTDILARYLTEDLPYREAAGGRRSMIEQAVSALYAPNGELATLATLHFRSGATRPVTPGALMSGALIEAATEEAKRRSCHRARLGEPAGRGGDDLHAPTDMQRTTVIDRRRTRTPRRLLDLPPDLDVVKVERASRGTRARRYTFTTPSD